MTESGPVRCPLCGATLSPEQIECASCGEALPKPEPVRLIRWRFVPTALLAIFGGMGVATGVLGLLMAGVVAIFFPMRRATIAEPLGMGLAGLCWGTLWLLAAHWCWQRRWLRFTLVFVGGYAVMGIVSLMATMLK